MFAWFSKRDGSGWSRRTRWTPLLQNQREFQRTLSKERARVDRNGKCFGFIILRLSNLDGARKQTQTLARLLHRRLRETDEKGHLGYGRLGVMLPETQPGDTEFVLNDILKLTGKHQLSIDGEAFVYPDQDSKPGAKDNQWDLVPHSLSGPSNANEEASPFAMLTPRYPRWKRAVDVLGSTAGLCLSSPLLVFLALLVKLSSRGPVLFCQRRTGFLGVPFTIYKLRTMVVNAEDLKAGLQEDNERDGPAFKMRQDPRITPIGRFLRATGLDELPQLFNVLRGDMSLVGPRPLPVEEAAQCLAWQKRREEVKPGLTCFWQLAKSRNVSFADWMRLDLKYARKTSFLLDAKLILKTLSSVLLGRVGH